MSSDQIPLKKDIPKIFSFEPEPTPCSECGYLWWSEATPLPIITSFNSFHLLSHALHRRCWPQISLQICQRHLALEGSWQVKRVGPWPWVLDNDLINGSQSKNVDVIQIQRNKFQDLKCSELARKLRLLTLFYPLDRPGSSFIARYGVE